MAKIPSGANPYTDWPSYVNPALFKGVAFYRNPSWLVNVAAHTDGAGVIWNTVTGFALRDETMAALQKQTAAGKEINATYLKKVLPPRIGDNPYLYWPPFTGKVSPTTVTAQAPASTTFLGSPYVLYAIIGIAVIGLIVILRRKK